MQRHLDLSDPANRDFLQRPDGRDQHQTQWHQWGIITHTRVFLRNFDEVIPILLRDWGIWEPVSHLLSEQIDGAPRRQLLRVSILLHDIGKFGARTRNRSGFHFGGHERLSGEIIREHLHLERFGLTPSQIEYIALTAEDHFVLGLVRKRAREQGRFDSAFVESDAFVRLSAEIRAAHPLDFVEIGVLFLGDSLAKARVEDGPARAVDQYPVNLAVARRYLTIVLAGPSL